MAESSYTDRKVIDFSRNFVNVIAHNEAEHKEREVQIGKEKKSLCEEFYTIPCEVHRKGYGAVNKFFSGNFSTPTTVFCDPAGKEIARKEGALGAGELAKEMQTVLQKVVGEKVGLAAWRQAKQALADADAALAEGNYKKAVDLFTKVSKMAGKAVQELGKEGLKKCGEAGAKLLEEALAMTDIEEKRKALKKLVEDFKGTETATRAKKELEAIK
ncbi:MAG: hypothetical protein HYY17_16295 [Planctomycetes bacterium]|nr:hypothetical protein [Planctomycetota bacterium]